MNFFCTCADMSFPVVSGLNFGEKRFSNLLLGIILRADAKVFALRILGRDLSDTSSAYGVTGRKTKPSVRMSARRWFVIFQRKDSRD
jgi:hypothetical protein